MGFHYWVEENGNTQIVVKLVLDEERLRILMEYWEREWLARDLDPGEDPNDPPDALVTLLVAESMIDDILRHLWVALSTQEEEI